MTQVCVGWYAQFSDCEDILQVGKKMQKYPSGMELFLTTDVPQATFGRVTTEERDLLHNTSHMVHPQDFKDNILFHAEYEFYQGNGLMKELKPLPEPSQEWKDLVIKVFNPKTIEFKYGFFIAAPR